MKECFEPKRFSEEAQEKIDKANEILADYEAQGYDLSLRQLYYQFVARDLLPNNERSYKNLGVLISDARLAGLIDWDMIRDRGRSRHINSHWSSPSEIIRSAAQSFAIDKWRNQEVHIEVMVEKQALEGVLLPVCEELDIAFQSNKGYSSSSALYENGKRLARIADSGKHLVVIYLGDHDPSGIDMTRDVESRLNQFANCDVEVRRIALNMDQVEELQPPENPAKLTDSRAEGYIARFGNSSWELDAIEPRALAELVRNEVYKFRDVNLWEQAVQEEDDMRQVLIRLAEENP